MKCSLYTDGACQPNPGKGGWAYIFMFDDDYDIDKEQGSGYVESSTNNRMEMQAVIEGLKFVFSKYPEKVNELELEIFSDSKYVVDGINIWSHSWKEKGWTKKGGKPIMNLDLWKDVRELADRVNVTCIYVRGHQGNHFNEIVDKIAVEAIKNHV